MAGAIHHLGVLAGFRSLRALAVQIREDRVLLFAFHEAREQVAIEPGVHLQQGQIHELFTERYF